MLNWDFLKNILYAVGSISGLIGFYRSFNKRAKCEFSYRTEYGNEDHPLLFCIRDNIYNLNISDEEQSVFVYKYKSDLNFSQLKKEPMEKNSSDRSSFFAVLYQGEALGINNDKLDIKPIVLHFEDEYSNEYKQYFSFKGKEKTNHSERVKFKSKSYYTLSTRYRKWLGMWLPIKKNNNFVCIMSIIAPIYFFYIY